MTVCNKYHLEFLKALKKHAGEGTGLLKERMKADTGSNKASYSIKIPLLRKIAKDWIKKHPYLSLSEYTALLNSLYAGKSHEELSLAGKLLEYVPDLRKQLGPCLLNEWLDKVEGWAEVDSICQSNFTPDEMFTQWLRWRDVIKDFSSDENIHKQRASLVLLTKPVRESNDAKLMKLAFKNIDRLKQEKDILITKAISWLLREMIKNFRSEVKDYLEKNEDSLPRIAVREVTNKLKTGKK